MKRLITVILVLALVVPAAAAADLPDISNLSKEELIQLDGIIQNMLFEQSLPDGVLLPAGNYVVGIDLPAGDYRADVVSDTGGIINIYKTKEDYESHPLLSLNQEIALGNMWGTLVFRLTLEEGNYVILKYNSLKLYRYVGLVDMSTPKE